MRKQLPLCFSAQARNIAYAYVCGSGWLQHTYQKREAIKNQMGNTRALRHKCVRRVTCSRSVLKGATLRYVLLVKSSFVIRVNPLHPQPSLLLYGFLLLLWCFSLSVVY